MNGHDQILISLEVRHAESILQGYKLVEFRRRTMKILPGATLWIYAKVPVGELNSRVCHGFGDPIASAVNALAEIWVCLWNNQM